MAYGCILVEMAKLPMLPLLAGAAALAAMAMLAPKRPKPGDPVDDPDGDPEGDPDDTPPQGETGERCTTGVAGQWAAVNADGNCVVFYDNAVHGALLRQTIRAVQKELGPSVEEICSGPRSVLMFPGTGMEEWRVNPGIAKIAREALHRFYRLPEGVWPPTPRGDPNESPYWVHSTWGIAVNVAGLELCGWTTES